MTPGPPARARAVGMVTNALGRKLQAARARRLARHYRVTCVLFAPEHPSLLPAPRVAGAAEVSPGQIDLWGIELWVTGVDLPGEQGPGPEPGPGDLRFRPDTRIFTLHTSRGTVRWAVLDWQADWAISLLGFPPAGGSESRSC